MQLLPTGGVLTRKVHVPESGNYAVWTRFYLEPEHTDPFDVCIGQPGNGTKSVTFYDKVVEGRLHVARTFEKDRGLSIDDPSILDSTFNSPLYLWERREVALEKGVADVAIIKV